MRKALLLSILFALGFARPTLAQSGCCSHHGGVCGCMCCDGTALSLACQPYFPCGPPAAPSGLRATALSSTRASLSWVDHSSNESSFRIESKVSSESLFKEIGSVGSNVTTTTIVNLTPSTTYSFRIRAQGTGGNSSPSNQSTITTPVETPPCADPALCFAGNRFKVKAHWKTKQGAMGDATVVRLTPDSGYLWFFASSNVELVFKVLDACSINGTFWFFAGGLTDVQTDITLIDTTTGREKVYSNPQGTAFRPIQDTAALPCQ